MSETFRLDPTTTALVLIEYQNEFTSEGGALNDAVAGDGENRGCSPTPWPSPMPHEPRA